MKKNQIVPIMKKNLFQKKLKILSRKVKMGLNKKTNLIFKKIENTRKLNNSNWMELLKIAYTSNPKKTTKILKKILQKDQALIKLAKSLTKKN